MSSTFKGTRAPTAPVRMPPLSPRRPPPHSHLRPLRRTPSQGRCAQRCEDTIAILAGAQLPSRADSFKFPRHPKCTAAPSSPLLTLLAIFCQASSSFSLGEASSLAFMAVSCAYVVRYTNPSSSSLAVLQWSPTMGRPSNGRTSSYASCQYFFLGFYMAVWPLQRARHAPPANWSPWPRSGSSWCWVPRIRCGKGLVSAYGAQISLAHVASIPSKTSKFCTELI
jgi:hypothetical protein